MPYKCGKIVSRPQNAKAPNIKAHVSASLHFWAMCKSPKKQTFHVENIFLVVTSRERENIIFIPPPPQNHPHPQSIISLLFLMNSWIIFPPAPSQSLSLSSSLFLLHSLSFCHFLNHYLFYRHRLSFVIFTFSSTIFHFFFHNHHRITQRSTILIKWIISQSHVEVNIW